MEDLIQRGPHVRRAARAQRHHLAQVRAGAERAPSAAQQHRAHLRVYGDPIQRRQ